MPLKSGNTRKRHFALMDVKPPQFGATMQLRKDFSRIEQMPIIKRTFQSLLLLQIIGGELYSHQVTLFNTNPMFTCENTAHLNTGPQNICSKFLSTL